MAGAPPPAAPCPWRRCGSACPVRMLPRHGVPRGRCREASPVLPHSDPDDPQLRFLDPTQYRYELIRPLLLYPERTATQRAQETGTHPETVSRLKRRFAQQGMLGLVPDTRELLPAHRQLRVPDPVVHELQRLQGLYAGFGARELARIIFHTTMHRIAPAHMTQDTCGKQVLPTPSLTCKH